MYTLSALFTNFPLICVAVAWILAQIIKIFTGYFSGDEKFNLVKFLCGTGGMPSSHSATVMALLVASAIRYGFGSFEIAVSILLAIIVMNDAMGVRYETGKQAKVINQLVKEIFSGKTAEVNKNLKELVGHTPFQVLVGALLGAAVPFLVDLFL
ncbi:MAG: divergent PAP2 family protein [Clostridia bacterium]|nr:divergent PAP2 family protein [Clostridia bacterium]